mgnify:CR=1 FL=1
MARKSRKFICEKCGNEFESKRKDVRFCSNSCRASIINMGRKPFNFVEGKIRYCLTCGKKLHHQTKTGYCVDHYVTDDFKDKISKGVKKIGGGGYRKNSGRGKHGWYKGFWCDSSWELAWVIYNLDHGIKFERNTKGFEYIFEEKIYKYYPDFKILKDNLYIEIKGWIDEKNKAKISQFKGFLKVLFRNDMKYIFEYVENKYGKQFIKMYE